MNLFFKRYKFSALYFLYSHQVVLVYHSVEMLIQDTDIIPATIAGFQADAQIQKFQTTSRIGTAVFGECGRYKASAGISVNDSAGRQFVTVPTHFMHAIFKNEAPWWQKLLASIWGYTPSCWREITLDGNRVNDFRSFDPELNVSSVFPQDFTSDISLGRLQTPLQHNARLTWHSKATTLPPKTAIEILTDNPASENFHGLALNRNWYTSVGIGLIRSEVGKKQTDGLDFNLINLWRCAGDDFMQSMAGCSGCPLAERMEDGSYGVIGFQSFESFVPQSRDSRRKADKEVQEGLQEGNIGFYASYHLPSDLVNNYNIV